MVEIRIVDTFCQTTRTSVQLKGKETLDDVRGIVGGLNSPNYNKLDRISRVVEIRCSSCNSLDLGLVRCNWCGENLVEEAS